MTSWQFLNLIWVVPISIIYVLYFIIFLWDQIKYWKVRKISKDLYGSIINICILCPKCRGFVYGNDWKEHLEYNHSDYPHFVRPIDEDFKDAIEKL